MSVSEKKLLKTALTLCVINALIALIMSDGYDKWSDFFKASLVIFFALPVFFFFLLFLIS